MAGSHPARGCVHGRLATQNVHSLGLAHATDSHGVGQGCCARLTYGGRGLHAEPKRAGKRAFDTLEAAVGLSEVGERERAVCGDVHGEEDEHKAPQRQLGGGGARRRGNAGRWVPRQSACCTCGVPCSVPARPGGDVCNCNKRRVRTGPGRCPCAWCGPQPRRAGEQSAAQLTLPSSVRAKCARAVACGTHQRGTPWRCAAGCSADQSQRCAAACGVWKKPELLGFRWGPKRPPNACDVCVWGGGARHIPCARPAHDPPLAAQRALPQPRHVVRKRILQQLQLTGDALVLAPAVRRSASSPCG